MIDYDQEVNKIRIYNQSILDEFQSWLKNTRVTTKTVKNHIDNMSFFAEYLVYYDSLNKLDEADAGDVYDFLADWFPRKAMWACESSTKSYMASFRRFFNFLRESNRIDDDSEIEVRDTLKEHKDEFLDAVALDDDDY